MNINERFGKQVRKLRLEQKLSQETLADMAEIDRSYLQDIERGVRNVSLVFAEKIAKALSKELKELL
jgi:transcriptional regulator with XRE-family HTH domain